MKKNVAHRQKSKRTVFGTCIGLAVILTVASIYMASAITIPPPEKEGIIDNYIAYLSKAGNAAARKGNDIHCELPGMGTENSALPDMTLEEAETAGVYNRNRSQTYSVADRANKYSAIAIQQHDLIVEQFGVNAWDNVSYELEVVEPLRGTLGYRVIATGELISQDEYERLIHDYWDGVAEREGVTYYDIFLANDEPVENMENKRVDLIAKYVNGLPAELTTVSDSLTYNVNLTFNGSAISDEGYDNFHFVIDNSSGSWTVFQGLTWLTPYPEFPVGD